MRFKTLLSLFLGLLLAGPVAAQLFNPPPTPPLEPENTLYLDLSTGGRVTIQLRPDVAPIHVARIKELTRRGFYNGLAFHRVLETFMAQTGDPKGDGSGGSDLPDLKAEFNGLPHVRGALGMARTDDPDSANSQFYIMFTAKLAMDGKYTVFGRVVGGMSYVDALNRGEPPLEPSRIVRASIGADNLPPPTPAELAAGAVAPPPPPAALPPPAPVAALPPPAAADAPPPPAPQPEATPPAEEPSLVPDAPPPG